MITIEPISDASIEYVLAHLRAGDAEELEAACVRHPAECFQRAARDAAYTGTVACNGQPIAIFGVNAMPDEIGVGLCWMVGTDGITRERIGFARASIEVVGHMRLLFPMLRNWVYCRNDDAITWLRWLGFEVDDDSPSGPGGMFYPFKMENASCVFH